MNTKRIIIDAAFELFESQPFDTISVQDILDRAHVSRGTFYNYFSDRYELMHLYNRSYMDQNISENFDGHNWKSIAESLFKFMSEKRGFFVNVKGTEGQDSFWDFLRQYSFDFYSQVKKHNEHRSMLSEKEDLTIRIHVEGGISILKMYIDGNIHLDHNELAERMTTIFRFRISNSYAKL